VALVAAGAWSLYLGASSAPAGASTLAGTATITDTSLVPLGSGASTTEFSVALPANAACTGDTATDGYHVYSYLVQQGTSITGITFTTHPSEGLGLVNDTGVYYGPINTAINTGQIVSIPNNFEWAPLLSDGMTLSSLLYGGSSGVWETGLACATSAGVLSDYWNTQVTFTASSSDTSGFVWSAVPGVVTSSSTTTTSVAGSTTTTTSSTTTTSAAGSTTTTTAGTTTTTAPGTTTTTVPGTTTTTNVGATTTTAAGGSTTTTTPVSTSSDSSQGADPSTASVVDASSSSLPLTGGSVRRDLVVGMLCIGFGLIFLGWSARLRGVRAPRVWGP
jgi:hypothetical protein